MTKPSLMIVDDEQLLAELLADKLSNQLGLEVVGRARQATEAIPMAAQHQPDLIPLDIEMPGMSGLDMIAPLRKHAPEVKIVMLSSHFDPYTVYKVMQGNVQGYVEKPSPLSVVVEAVQRVLEGQRYFSPGRIKVKQDDLSSREAVHKILSEREQEALRLVATGLSDEEIAVWCKIAVQTVAARSDRELRASFPRVGKPTVDFFQALENAPRAYPVGYFIER